MYSKISDLLFVTFFAFFPYLGIWTMNLQWFRSKKKKLEQIHHLRRMITLETRNHLNLSKEVEVAMLERALLTPIQFQVALPPPMLILMKRRNIEHGRSLLCWSTIGLLSIKMHPFSLDQSLMT